jgi:hypothetical protein
VKTLVVQFTMEQRGFSSGNNELWTWMLFDEVCRGTDHASRAMIARSPAPTPLQTCLRNFLRATGSRFDWVHEVAIRKIDLPDGVGEPWEQVIDVEGYPWAESAKKVS